jgi:V8-like Glu-specific endopeptidase
MVLCLSCLAFAAGRPAVTPAIVEVGHERLEGGVSLEQARFEMQDKFDWLYSEQVPLWDNAILRIQVTDEDLIALQEYRCETCGDDPYASSNKLRVGVVKPAGIDIDFSTLRRELAGREGRLFSHGMIQATRDGGFVWTIGVESANASALRLRLSNFHLPENAELYIYNDTDEAFGPYTGAGPNGDGDFWTHTVFGPGAYLQIRYHGRPAAQDLQSIRFRIADVAHMGPNFLVGILGSGQPIQDKVCSFNAACVMDLGCDGGNWSAANTVKYGIGHMLFVSGAYYYICSGGLLNDTDTTTQIPYFLTANHCISKSTEASSLEVYFQFWTTNCSTGCYEPYNGVKPRTLGSTIVKTNRTGDYTLLKLSQAPPSGSVFLGWSTTAVANTNGTALYRLSHPQGAPMAISMHTVNTSAVTCRSWPRGSWVYSRDTYGATEGGSSGSPVCLVDGKVVGQLSGACGTNLNDVCDATRNATVDGAFASYFTEVESYLGSGGSGCVMHVASTVLSTTKKGSKYTAVATVTILDANNQPVSGATVTGTFSGYLTGTYSAVTNTSGVATVKSAAKSGTGAFNFAVTSVVKSGCTF